MRIETQEDCHKLQAGMFARVTIVFAAHAGVLLVPTQALLQTGEDSPVTVFALADSHMAERRPPAVGFQNGRFVETLSGLNEGELVATSGLTDLARC